MTEPIPAPFDAYRDVVRNEWIDRNGHLNMGYYVVVGNRRAFVSSYHLVPDKEAQLKKLNKEDQ